MFRFSLDLTVLIILDTTLVQNDMQFYIYFVCSPLKNPNEIKGVLWFLVHYICGLCAKQYS